MNGPPQSLTAGDTLLLHYAPVHADPPLDLEVKVTEVWRDSEGVEAFDANDEWTVLRSEWEQGVLSIE